MIITILRHGEAGIADRDRERELTPRGVDDISFGSHRFLQTCTERGIPIPELVLHSPWLRTAETADILARLIPEAELRAESGLQPGSTVSTVSDVLTALDDDAIEHVVLVSHQPLVSDLVDTYLGTAGLAPPLSPGGLVCLSLGIPGQGCASLNFWALPPEYEPAL